MAEVIGNNRCGLSSLACFPPPPLPLPLPLPLPPPCTTISIAITMTATDTTTTNTTMILTMHRIVNMFVTITASTSPAREICECVVVNMLVLYANMFAPTTNRCIYESRTRARFTQLLANFDNFVLPDYRCVHNHPICFHFLALLILNCFRFSYLCSTTLHLFVHTGTQMLCRPCSLSKTCAVPF